MLRLSLFLLLTSFAVGSVQSRQLPPDMMNAAKDKMAELAWLEGSWTGESWMQMGPDRRETATVLEQVEFRLDGTLLLIEGRGEHDGQVVHSAVATIVYNPMEQEFVMRAHRAGGLLVDADIEVDGGKVTWGFEDPRAGRIRYTIEQGPNGEWVESGSMTRDGGQNWFPFFGMTLTRSE